MPRALILTEVTSLPEILPLTPTHRGVSLNWGREGRKGGRELGSGMGWCAPEKSIKGRGRGERPVLGICKVQDPHGYGILAVTGAWGLRHHLTDGDIEAQMSRMPWLKLPP